MKTVEKKRLERERRHRRIRAKVSGTALRPRLAVYKSNRYLHAQLIDDTKGMTLASGTSKEQAKEKKMEAAAWLGAELAKRARAKGISSAVFDRGGFRFSGRVAALAAAARKGGLEF